MQRKNRVIKTKFAPAESQRNRVKILINTKSKMESS
jgi:hypothetical protein